MTTLAQTFKPNDEPARVIPANVRTPNVRSNVRTSGADWLVRTMILALVVYGCAKTVRPTGADPTGDQRHASESVADILPRTVTIDKHTQDIEKNVPEKVARKVGEHTSGIRAESAVIRRDAESATGSLAAAQVETDALKGDKATLIKQLADEKTAHADDLDHWYVRFGRPIDHFLKVAWWLAVLVIGGGFVLRVVGMFAGGWIGATTAKLGSIGLHFLPVVGGIVNQFFDNAFYRQRQFVLNNPKPSPPVGVVVEQPLDPEGDVSMVSEPQAMRVAPQPVYTSMTRTRTTTRKPVKKGKR